MKRLPLRKDALIAAMQTDIERLETIDNVRGNSEAIAIANDLIRIAEEIKYAAKHIPIVSHWHDCCSSINQLNK